MGMKNIVFFALLNIQLKPNDLEETNHKMMFATQLPQKTTE